MKEIVNLIGQKFDRLTVVETIKSNFYLCKCDCGNEKRVSGSDLKRGHIRSCGCLRREIHKKQALIMADNNRKLNKYIKKDNYYIGIDFSDKIFYLSEMDYELVKDLCWHINRDGYVCSRLDGKNIFMHRFIMGIAKKEYTSDIVIDHINRKRNDNRRENLRICSIVENNRNKTISSNNKSGFIGVIPIEDKYVSYIQRKRIGTFNTIEEAVVARLKAEKEIFGDSSPQRDLFEEYGIKEWNNNEN